MTHPIEFRFFSKKFNNEIEKIKQLLVDENIIERIWKKDFTVWKNDPDEISNRLGWLDAPTNMIQNIDKLNKFVQDIRSSGFTTVLPEGNNSFASIET